MKNKIIRYGIFSIALLLTACGTNEQSSEDVGTTDDTVEDVAEEQKDASIKMMYTAPHGNQSFAVTFVAMNGEKVADVMIDEFQFMEGDDWDGVPNNDETFGESYDDELTLSSKRENNDPYSAMMTEIADSTISYNDNLDAVQDFAKGKTLAELEEAISELDGLGENDPIADVVTGATLVDTSGYLQSIIDTANNGFDFAGAKDSDLTNAELSYSLQAPHGDRSFAIVAVLQNGNTVLAAALDELQFVDSAEFEGVPNSDQTFGENYAEGVVLASKIQNSEAYSAMMKEAGATSTYEDNVLAIIQHTLGSTAEEIDASSEEVENLGDDEAVADVISGATFVDTAGYLKAISETLEN